MKSKLCATKAVTAIKRKAMNSKESSSTIVNNTLQTVPLKVSNELPSKSNLLKRIRRQRADPMVPGENPNRIADEFRTTTRGENLVLFENDKMFIFGTHRNLTVLAHNRHWFAEGTFKVAPHNFYQLYTLHAFIDYLQTIPLIYFILMNKTQDFVLPRYWSWNPHLIH